MKLYLTAICILTSILCGAQENTFTGKVFDAKTRLPMINANVRLQQHQAASLTDRSGKFTIPLLTLVTGDTLIISYVGYRTLKTKLTSPLDTAYWLEESAVILDPVTILSKSPAKFEVKKLESSLRQIRGTLYACEEEVSNKEFNKFLTYLLQNDQHSLYERYKPDLTGLEGTLLAVFKGYHLELEGLKNSEGIHYSNYPVANISYEAAVAYCEWLTEQYNKAKKKKFKQATFRLPELKEWQIAALGYPKFTSWVLDENEVEVRLPDHPGEMMGKQKKIIPVKGSDIRYPWFGAYEYRNKPQNHKNCWLGNFNVPDSAVSCEPLRPGGDGFFITSSCGAYFPNDMGLYDVVGNVAEMINEKGTACGGSWNHAPEQSTITSVSKYSGASEMVGFRVFMDAGR